ncbi:MAG: hypothetical protein JXB36_06385, partial [Gammaproteobacteria bacterium]|nr:hypothetical protein [Gammaproteobacteria bacterium]
AEQYQWDWEVSLQPFPGPQAATPASGIVASGAVPGQPVADQVGSFWVDFDDIPPLGQPFPTASESDGDTIAVVPGAASVAPATEGRHRAARAPRTGAAIPSPESRGEGGGALGQVLSVPTNIPVPEHAIDFHVRLVPRLPDGAPAGPPSNAVLLHYEPGADPATVQALEVAKEKAAVQHALDALESQAGQLYQLQILEFSPVVFADPNRWGCIEVIEKGIAVPTVAGYMAGETYCPGPWQGSGDSFGLDDLDPIDIAEGLADFVSGLYDDLKEGVLDLAMQGLPCPSSLEGACRAALSTALDAALASAGIPPSLPNFEEMKAAAEGELVDLAMETALNELPGGVACKGIPQCEQELRNAISTAIDQGVDAIIASSSEPHCGNVAQAHAHGREPLPCFNELPGWKVVPAAGAVYEPATVTVRVTRTAAPLPAGLEPSRCEVVVGMTLHNTFAGGRLGGNVDYQIVGPTELSGEPFHPAGLQIPPLAANQSATLTLALTRFTDFVIPGFSTLHHPYIRWEHWLPLYSGEKGVLSGRTSAHAAVKQGDATLAAKPVACGAAAQLPVP